MSEVFRPYLIIAGPTASGKTALSVQVAKALGGDVVCADSMQIYDGVSIGTARPTPAEMQGVAHHLFGHVPLCEKYSVVRYLEEAEAVVATLFQKGTTPILCGGTGLYIQSFIENRQLFLQEPDPVLRQQLDALDEAALFARLQEVDPLAASRLHPHDRHRVIRALEVYYTTGYTIEQQNEQSLSKPSPYTPCLFVLDFHSRERLYDRINRRVDIMLEQGLLEEAHRVLQTDPDATVTQAIGYKEFAAYFSGNITLEEAAEKLKQQTRRYAKRQLSWFRRMSSAHTLWVDDYASTEALTEQILTIYREFTERGQKNGEIR